MLQGALSRHDTRLTNMEQWGVLTVSTLLRIVSRLWSIGVMSLLRAWARECTPPPGCGIQIPSRAEANGLLLATETGFAVP